MRNAECADSVTLPSVVSRVSPPVVVPRYTLYPVIAEPPFEDGALHERPTLPLPASGAFSVGERYIEYVTPGMILLAITYGLSSTAVSVNSDMAKGIINRFKVMNVSRGAVLTGHVVATMLSTSVAVAVIIAVGFALGFRSPATALDWLGAIGIIAATAFAAAWLTVALGMFAKTPESAGLTVVPLIMLPFLSSAIAPTARMGQGVRQFAEYQPFTPIIESLRGLLAGSPSGGYAAAALAWCAGIALVGYLWSRATFSKRA